MAAQEISFGTTRSGFGFTPTLSLLPSTRYTFSIYAQIVSGNGTFYFGYYDGTHAIDPANNNVSGPFTATGTWTRFGPFSFTTGLSDVSNEVVVQNVTTNGGTTTVGVIAFWGSELEPNNTWTTFQGCAAAPAPPTPPPGAVSVHPIGVAATGSAGTVTTTSSVANLAVDSQESAATSHHSATSPLTYNFTNTAGTLLLVGVSTSAITAISAVAVTYNGVSMTKVTGTPLNNVYLFYLSSPATGANNIVVTVTGTFNAGSDVFGSAISFVGNRVSTPVGSATTAAANSVTASVTLTGTSSSDYVVSYFSTGTGVTSAISPTVLSAHLNVGGGTASDNVGLGYQPTNAGGSITASYTVGLDQWQIVAAEIFHV